MTPPASQRSQIAILKGFGQNRYLVLTRNYGALISVVLDDSESSEDCAFNVVSTHAALFLEPFSDQLVVPEFKNEYDAILLHLSTADLPILGPLSSARAALAMKELHLSVETAIAYAAKLSLLLVEQQAVRRRLIAGNLTATK